MMMRKLLPILIVLLWLVPAAAAQSSVVTGLPDLPPGQQVTIRYAARVNEALPPGLQYIVDQGVITSSSGERVLTDDPAVAGDANSTRTLVGFTLNVGELPNTGETPWWRILLLSLGAASLAALGAFAALHFRGRRSTS